MAADKSAPQLYVPSPAGAFGCRFCRIMRELLTFVWKEDIPRFKALWASGECSATMAGCAYTRVEAGDEFSLFRIPPGVFPELAKQIGAIWIRNSDMHVLEEPTQ